MARLVVLAEGEVALGFQLAGVEVICVDDADSAREHLLDLLQDASIGLVAASAGLLEQLDDALRRRVEANSQPVVVPLPCGSMASGAPGQRQYLAAMIRRAIGFQITFPGEGG